MHVHFEKPTLRWAYTRCIRGHNWTVYRPGTQFGYGGLGTAMHAHERATPMRYTHLRCTSCEIYAPIRCRLLRCMPAKETRLCRTPWEMRPPMRCTPLKYTPL